MSAANQSTESYYMQFLRCDKCFNLFEYENKSYLPITSAAHNNTICKQCFDGISVDQPPINYPLLLIICDPSQFPEDDEQRYGQCLFYRNLDHETKEMFNSVTKQLCAISIKIKEILISKECELVFSRSLIRKIFSLIKSEYLNNQGRMKFLKTIRNLGEHICTEFFLAHQSPQQLTNELWSIIGFQNQMFYQSAVQENVLNRILLFFKSHEESRAEDIISFVKKDIPENDRHAIRHIIDLLAGASCFQVHQTGNCSLMQLKQEFTNYEDLRAAYNSKIIEMLMKQGICLPAEQYSLLIYGDIQHDLSTEMLLDKLSSSKLFSQAIKQFVDVVKRAGRSSEHLLQLEHVFQRLSEVADANEECHMNLSKFSRPLMDIQLLLQTFIDF